MGHLQAVHGDSEANPLIFDVAIFLSQATAKALYEAVRNDYMTSKSDIDESLQSTEEFCRFQLIHFEETFKIDVFVMSRDEYSSGVFPRALRYPIFDGHLANYASPGRHRARQASLV